LKDIKGVGDDGGEIGENGSGRVTVDSNFGNDIFELGILNCVDGSDRGLIISLPSDEPRGDCNGDLRIGKEDDP